MIISNKLSKFIRLPIDEGINPFNLLFLSDLIYSFKFDQNKKMS